ncbi:efflux RND transporter permease subunit [Gemmata sp. JC673]|uniref:Efflux RND transporter permease subunit n=1 Tax=Gemmata algarum TaxID=2975278 RepID=A0ABU5F3W6_9BACT|nr:efflux RND transporter permease subunit [Gemmata algarum]MDY3561833.1 efflux RND transporter permease subunit [Gemmata algarum]
MSSSPRGDVVRTTPRLLPVLLLAVSACGSPTLPAPPDAPDPPATKRAGPTVRVDAVYPGGSAHVICDTVAVPIEHQMKDLEEITSLESECRNDGSYRLTVRFKSGTDVNVATALVRERVALINARLPPLVCREGVTVRNDDPGRFPTLWVAAASPNGTYDAMFLNNYAAQRVKDELTRVPGVADVRAVSRSEIAIRVWPDPDKLAASQITIRDIVQMVELHNIRMEAGQPGRALAKKIPPLTFTFLGRRPDVEQLHRTFLKETSDEKIICLGDVSRVELAPKSDGFTRVGGKPAALQAVRVDDTKSVIGELRKRFAEFEKTNPKDLTTGLVADLSADRCAVIELWLPAAASSARTQDTVARVEKLIRGLPESPDCLAFSERETDAVTFLVKLPPGVGPADLRKALAEIREVSVRVSDLSSDRPFPVRVAILDKGRHGWAKLREVGDTAMKRLAKDGLALDPALTPAPGAPHLSITLDRKKLKELGLNPEDVVKAIGFEIGDPDFTDAILESRSMRHTLGEQFRGAGELKKVALKAPAGKTIPLGAVAEVHEFVPETTILRVNLHPALVVTADVPPGKTVTEVTAECVRAAKAVVPRGFEVCEMSAA